MLRHMRVKPASNQGVCQEHWKTFQLRAQPWSQTNREYGAEKGRPPALTMLRPPSGMSTFVTSPACENSSRSCSRVTLSIRPLTCRIYTTASSSAARTAKAGRAAWSVRHRDWMLSHRAHPALSKKTMAIHSTAAPGLPYGEKTAPLACRFGFKP